MDPSELKRKKPFIDQQQLKIRNSLFEAAKTNNINQLKEIQHLIKLDDLNAKDSNKNTALYYACLNGNVLMANILIRMGANVEMKCRLQDTCVHAAFRGQKENII